MNYADFMKRMLYGRKSLLRWCIGGEREGFVEI